LLQLQEYLEDKEPCYILARLDDPPSEWLAVSYVPDSAKVRDKVGIMSMSACWTAPNQHRCCMLQHAVL